MIDNDDASHQDGPEPAPLPPTEPAPPPTTEATPPPTQNEPASETSLSPENPVVQKVEPATRGLFEKMGFKFKRKAGRPRSDGMPKANDVAMDFPEGNGPASVAGGSPPSDGPRSAALVKRCAKAACRALASVGDKLLFNKAVLATSDKEFARDVVKETTVTEGEAEAFAEMAQILAEMYGYDPKILALIVGMTVTGAAAGRYAIAIQGLNAQIKAKGPNTAKP